MAGRAVTLVSMALTVVLVAGCGGPSRDEYVEHGDEICERTSDELAQIPQGKRRAGRVADAYGAAIADLRALEVPDEVRAEADKLLASLGAQVEITRELPDELAGAPGSTRAERETNELSRLLQESRRAERESLRLAKAIGFETCGR